MQRVRVVAAVVRRGEALLVTRAPAADAAKIGQHTLYRGIALEGNASYAVK